MKRTAYSFDKSSNSIILRSRIEYEKATQMPRADVLQTTRPSHRFLAVNTFALDD